MNKVIYYMSLFENELRDMINQVMAIAKIKILYSQDIENQIKKLSQTSQNLLEID